MIIRGIKFSFFAFLTGLFAATLLVSFYFHNINQSQAATGGAGNNPNNRCDTREGKECYFNIYLADSSYQAYAYEANTHIDSIEGGNAYLRIETRLTTNGWSSASALGYTYGPINWSGGSLDYTSYFRQMDLGDLVGYNFLSIWMFVDDMYTNTDGWVYGRKVSVDRFDAVPSTITAGQGTRLYWDTDQIVDGSFINITDPSGNIISSGVIDNISTGLSIAPPSTSTYTLNAYGPGTGASGDPGWINRSVTVTVTNPPSPSLSIPPPSGDIWTNISSCTAPCNVIVDYNTQNVSTCSIYKNGSGWQTNLQPNCPAGTRQDNGLSAGTYTYSLRNDSTGNTLDSTTVTVNPTGGGNPPPEADLRCNGNSGSCSITSGGLATIEWCGSGGARHSCANSDACNVTVGGSPWQSGLSGNYSTGPLTSSVSGVLTCNGPGGSSSSTVSINVGSSNYNLTVNITGTGSGTVTGPGISCPGDCSETYPAGASGALTGNPNPPSNLTWSGCDSMSGNSCSLTMNSDRTVNAIFNLPGGGTGDISVSSNQSVTWCISGPFSICEPSPLPGKNYNNKPAGTYTISPENVSGYTVTVTPSLTQTLTNTSNISFSLNYSSGGGESGPIVKLRGYVVRDTNGNLQKDAGESEIDGARIILRKSTQSGCLNPVYATEMTTGGMSEGPGYYEFGGLYESMYYRAEIDTSTLNSGYQLAPGESAVVCVGPGGTGQIPQPSSPWGEDFAVVDVPPPPTVTNLTVSVNNSNYCAVGVHATVSGTYTSSGGGNMNAYEIQIDDDTNPLTGNPEWESGTVSTSVPNGGTFSGIASNCNASNPDISPQTTCQMAWNTAYRAWARVRNISNQWSSWILMNTYCNGGSCNSATSWQTPRHPFPKPDFNFSPVNPLAKKPVQFTDATIFDPASTGQGWSWSFPGGNPSSRTGQGPHVINYSTSSSYQATLTASDDVGSCTISKTVNVKRAVPRWIEIAPR